MVRKRLKQILRKRPVIALLAAVTLLTITIAAGSVLMVQRYVAVSQALQQSFDYNLQLERVLSEVRNAGSNQRQFLITGDASYSAAYAKSVKSINNQLAPLKSFLEPKQFEKMSQLVSARLASLDKSSEILAAGDRQAAIDFTANIEALRLTSDLSAQVTALEQQKTRQIQSQRQATDRLSGLLIVGITTCALLSCLLIGFAARLVYDLERKDQDLRRSQARLQSIVDNAPNYIQMLDVDLKRVFINRAAERRTSESLIGHVFGDFMKASERHRVQKILRRVMKTGRSTELEYTTYINNSQQWYKNSVGPIFTDGRITGLVLSTFDISQERLALKKLEEQKKAAEAAKIQAQTLLSSIGEGLLVIDEHGVIASVNSSAAAALGYDVKTLTGKWFPGTVLALDDQGKSIDPLNRPATQALMSGRSISETVWYQRKDGSVFPVAVTVSPVILDGRPVGAIEVFRDLTNERELERAKEEFVSLASHQLRTPATGAKAFISLLLDGYAGKLSERQKEYMQKIRKANERQLEIINDMLNVARIDSGRIMPEMVSADIAEILEDIIEVHQPVAMERSQRLELILPSHRSAVVCDPKLIHMALENIVNNASKYTHKGGSIGVSLRFSENQAHVRVEDTGVGIAVEDQSKIFQRFARVYNPLSVARGGTGLGLYLTRNIVDMHQGRIGVDSKPGAGTIFDIELPLQPIGSLAQFADNQVTLGREK